MRRIIIILILLINAGVYAQTTNPVKTSYINGVRTPNGATAPTSPNKGDLWFDPSVNKLKVYNGTLWELQQSNLSLGTATTTTQPITNSNGTGFTLPSAVAGSAAGLMSAADKTKLDAISGTNTGNQSLSTTNLGGAITISGTGGNTINLKSLDATSVTDANTIQTANGFYTTYSTTGSSNFPSASGGGFRSVRTGSSALGSFEFWKSGGTTEDLYFRVGNGASTFSTWDILAGRNYIAALYAPLASPAFTGTPTVPTATAGTNTTQAASTAFVANAVSANNPMTATGDIIRGGASGVPTRLGIGGEGQVLTVSGGVPTWQGVTGRSALGISSNFTLFLNSDYIATSATQYTVTLPSTSGFSADGTKIITVLVTGTGGIVVSVPSGYSMQSGTSFATTTGSGGATLTQGQKVQLIPIGTNSWYLQPLNGSVTLY